jgi:hypothetical protein
MDKTSRLDLLVEVLIENYRAAHHKLTIEPAFFRFMALIILTVTIVIPVSFSPIGVGLISIIVAIYWSYRKYLLEREIRAFDDLIVDQERHQEESHLAKLYITWRHVASTQGGYDWILRREPWVWSILALMVATLRGT